MEGGGTDLRCREVCRRVQIEIDSMVDKSYEGFKALFSSLEIRVEMLNYSNTSGEETLESTWMRGAMTFS